MLRKLEELYYDAITRLFIWTGFRLFRLVVLYNEDGDGEMVRAAHFALSEADLNTSMRVFVEELDRPKTETQTNNQ